MPCWVSSRAAAAPRGTAAYDYDLAFIRHVAVSTRCPTSERAKRNIEYAAGTRTNNRSRSRPSEVGLNQFGMKRMFPPLALNGSGLSLPPSSQVKASMGRGTDVRFVMPRCQTLGMAHQYVPARQGNTHALAADTFQDEARVLVEPLVRPRYHVSRSILDIVSTTATLAIMKLRLNGRSMCQCCVWLPGRLKLQPTLGMRSTSACSWPDQVDDAAFLQRVVDEACARTGKAVEMAAHEAAPENSSPDFEARSNSTASALCSSTRRSRRNDIAQE